MGLQGELRDFDAVRTGINKGMQRRRMPDDAPQPPAGDDPTTTSHNAGAEVMQPVESVDLVNKGYRKGGMVRRNC